MFVALLNNTVHLVVFSVAHLKSIVHLFVFFCFSSEQNCTHSCFVCGFSEHHLNSVVLSIAIQNKMYTYVTNSFIISQNVRENILLADMAYTMMVVTIG